MTGKENCAGTGGSRTWGRCEERGEGSRDPAKGTERSPGPRTQGDEGVKKQKPNKQTKRDRNLP